MYYKSKKISRCQGIITFTKNIPVMVSNTYCFLFIEKVAQNLAKHTCHLWKLSKPSRKNTVKKTIVKFVNRKKADLAFRNRRKLKDVYKSYNTNFTGNEQVFINENLTPYYSALAWKCRSLKKKGFIRDLKIYFVQIKITIGFIKRIHYDT